MLTIDDRVGSKELFDGFKQFGIKCILGRLEFGDMCWEGRGPMGSCLVGVERKRILDLTQSMQSRRLSGHQLPGMAQTFDYAYLYVEGFWGPDEDGRLLVNKQKQGTMYRAVDNHLTTLEMKTGLVYRRTISSAETVASVVNQYRWWTEKSWDEHVSHEAVYAPADRLNGRQFLFAPREVPLLEKLLMQLPGIDSAATSLAKQFKSPSELNALGIHDWCELRVKDRKGNYKRLGQTRGEKIWKIWNGIEEEGRDGTG